jgi:CheY-like chemotaxis protein
VASEGAAALAALARTPYDAVILDLMMPGVSGFEVIEHLEKDNPLNQRVIVLSAAAPNTIEDLKSSAIRSKLRKPFDIQELFAAIDGCVASRD